MALNGQTRPTLARVTPGGVSWLPPPWHAPGWQGVRGRAESIRAFQDRRNPAHRSHPAMSPPNGGGAHDRDGRQGEIQGRAEASSWKCRKREGVFSRTPAEDRKRKSIEGASRIGGVALWKCHPPACGGAALEHGIGFPVPGRSEGNGIDSPPSLDFYSGRPPIHGRLERGRNPQGNAEGLLTRSPHRPERKPPRWPFLLQQWAPRKPEDGANDRGPWREEIRGCPKTVTRQKGKKHPTPTPYRGWSFGLNTTSEMHPLIVQSGNWRTHKCALVSLQPHQPLTRNEQKEGILSTRNRPTPPASRQEMYLARSRITGWP